MARQRLEARLADLLRRQDSQCGFGSDGVMVVRVFWVFVPFDGATNGLETLNYYSRVYCGVAGMRDLPSFWAGRG